jgi:hypothetical protein
MAPFALELTGYRPLRRLDGAKWTQARIFEAASLSAYPAGGTLIQTIALPVYPDAADPPVFNFTVTNAQLLSGWYWVVFVDPGLVEFPTTPEGGSGTGVSLPPSPGAVRSGSAWLTARFPDSVDENDEKVRQAVNEATALVTSLTGRDLSGALGRSADGADLDLLAMRAVRLMTELMLGGEGTEKARGGALGSSARLSSFTAGPYSESYFNPSQAVVEKRLSPDPALHDVLWALATDAKRSEWLALWGQATAPFSGVRAFSYGNRRHLIR